MSRWASLSSAGFLFLCLLLLSLLVVACTSVEAGRPILPQSTRPIIKIGLIAPFEGLYRRTGYEAFFAARMALDDHREHILYGEVDLLIQALNGSAEPEYSLRAAEKLLADPAVSAIVGPFAPWVITEGNRHEWSSIHTPIQSPIQQQKAQTDALRLTSDPFFESPWMQFTPQHDGEETIHPQSLFSQQDLIKAVAQAVIYQGAQRLLIDNRGLSPLPDSAAIPLVIWDRDLPVDETDSILWMGDPAAGVVNLNRLRDEGWLGPFWFGPWGGDPVVREHAKVYQDVYWAIWQDSRYTDWSKFREPSSPFAYLVYRTTEKTVGRLLNRDNLSDSSSDWQIVFYMLEGDGLSYLFNIED